MFEHFTFGAQAQTRYYLQDEIISASPTDTSFNQRVDCSRSRPSYTKEYSFPQIEVTEPHPGLNDIVSQFTRYTLRPVEEDLRPRILVDDNLLSPCSAEDKRFEDQAFEFPERLQYVSTRSCGLRTFTPSSSISDSTPGTPVESKGSGSHDGGCRRQRRQLNTQLQSCTNHVRDINSLVEDMISTGDQCRLFSTSTSSSITPPRSRLASHISIASDLSMSDATNDNSEEESLYGPPQSIDPNEDEGFAEMEDDDLQAHNLSLRSVRMPNGIRKAQGPTAAVAMRMRGSGAGLDRSFCLVPQGVKRRHAGGLPRMRKRRGAVKVETE